jgi:transposase
VDQIDDGLKRLLWIGGERTEESLRGFFQFLSDRTRSGIGFVCSDMWRPYLKVVREELGQVVHILDRFHVMKRMNEAIDQVRREEVARLKGSGYEHVLKHSRWCLMKRPENLTDQPLSARASPAGGLLAVLGLQQPRMGGQVL